MKGDLIKDKDMKGCDCDGQWANGQPLYCGRWYMGKHAIVDTAHDRSGKGHIQATIHKLGRWGHAVQVFGETKCKINEMARHNVSEVMCSYVMLASIYFSMLGKVPIPIPCYRLILVSLSHIPLVDQNLFSGCARQ